jgi:glycosyltransferase involved in cell wall biosynthesis
MKIKSLVIDVSPLTSLPVTGIGKILVGLIDELRDRDDVRLSYFALVARGLLPQLRSRYHGLHAPEIPARFSKKALRMIQGLGIPIEAFCPKADGIISADWLCLPSRRGKSIAIVADATPLTDPLWQKKETIDLFIRRLTSIKRNADLVVAISQSTRRDLIHSANIDSERIMVAYPGLTKIFFKKPAAKDLSRVKKKYRLPAEFLLFVGTQEPRKNLKNIFSAWSALDKSEKKGTRLVLAGQKGWERSLTAPAQVARIGFVADADLPAIYTLARGLIYPSLKEGFGFPILEAFQMGVPVLTSDRSSMKEIAGDASILVNPDSVDDLKRGLVRLLALSQTQREDFIRAGKKRLRGFSFRTMADKIMRSIK